MTRAKDISKIVTDANLSGTLDVTGEVNLTTHLNMGDNDIIKLGDSADLQIYHDSATGHSIINESGTGSLQLRGTNIQLKNSDNTKNYIAMTDGGDVDLYYDNAPKLSTTATGIDVTGTATMDGLTVDGSATIDLTSDANPTAKFSRGSNNTTNVNYYYNTTLTGQLGASSSAFEISAVGSSKPLNIFVNGTVRQKIDTNGDISFYEDTGTTPKLFWDSSNESLAVGTTSVFNSKITASSANGTAYGSASQLRISSGGVNNNRASIVFSDDALSDGKISYYPAFLEADRSFSISARQNEADFVVKGNGNVGIGLTVPTTPLHIYTSGTSMARFVGGNDGNLFITNDSTNVVTLQAASGDALSFNTNGGNERMRIDSSGNVGIGTDSPASLLHIKSSTSDVRLQLTNSSSDNDTISSGASFQLNNYDLYINAVENSGNIIFRTDGGTGGFVERMRITSAGNVGIGNSNPEDFGSLVDNLVVGTTSGENGITIASGTGNSGRIQFADNTATPFRGAIEYVHGSTDALLFFTAGTQRMKIDSAGHVTMPYQSAFLVSKNSQQSNIPINTVTTVTFETEVFDQNNDFSSNTFTAPVTGKYQLNLYLRLNNLDTAPGFYQVAIKTSNREYTLITLDPNFSSDLNYYFFTGSTLADMDANDTAYITIYQNNGTAQSDIEAGTNTMFSGYLAC